jgi:hypothetical protein
VRRSARKCGRLHSLHQHAATCALQMAGRSRRQEYRWPQSTEPQCRRRQRTDGRSQVVYTHDGWKLDVRTLQTTGVGVCALTTTANQMTGVLPWDVQSSGGETSAPGPIRAEVCTSASRVRTSDLRTDGGYRRQVWRGPDSRWPQSRRMESLRHEYGQPESGRRECRRQMSRHREYGRPLYRCQDMQTAGLPRAGENRRPDCTGPEGADGGSPEGRRAVERNTEARRALGRNADVGAKQDVCSTELRCAACGGLHFGVQTSAFPRRRAHRGTDVRTAARADVSIRRCHLVGDFT